MIDLGPLRGMKEVRPNVEGIPPGLFPYLHELISLFLHQRESVGHSVGQIEWVVRLSLGDDRILEI